MPDAVTGLYHSVQKVSGSLNNFTEKKYSHSNSCNNVSTPRFSCYHEQYKQALLMMTAESRC